MHLKCISVAVGMGIKATLTLILPQPVVWMTDMADAHAACLNCCGCHQVIVT